MQTDASFIDTLTHADGQWRGTNKLRVMPTDPFAPSQATLRIALIAHNNYALLTYTWADKDQPQDGVLLLQGGARPGEVQAVWGDSWHQTPQWMELKGAFEGGVIRLKGDYSFENKPCSWRIAIDVRDGGELRMTMDNVIPSLNYDYQAVEAVYVREVKDS